MSHMVTRQGPLGDDKDKRQSDSPVKEMKKKIAANAEKEKQAAEKNADKSDKTAEKSAEKKDKVAEKQTDKSEKMDESEKHGEKSTEKKEKQAEKNVEKPAEKKDKREKSLEKAADKKEKREKSLEKVADKKEKRERSLEKAADKKEKREKSIEKAAEKNDKVAEKAADKKEKTDKKDVPEKSKEEASSAEKSAKRDKSEEPRGRKHQETVKLNGVPQNGSANGAGSSSDDDDLIIVEQPEDNDEMFPELAYDDNSDADGFEPDTPASRSLTRRSQVKATRTPETPRPVSAAPQPRDPDHSKEPKVLRLIEDAVSSDRRLRSSNSPKPIGKDSPRNTDSPSKGDLNSRVHPNSTSKGEVASNTEAAKSDVLLKEAVVIINVEKLEEPAEKSERTEMEVVVEPENNEGGDLLRRDTHYSRSRVKVSPYRRSAQLVDTTHASFVSAASHTSLVANYTGNNTTMEMDLTEMSTEEESPPGSPAPNSSFLDGLRTIRARRSYKKLANVNDPPPHLVQMAYARAHANLATAKASANVAPGRDSRPTGTVVGRKRRPDAGEEAEAAQEATEAPKRARLLDRLARPFRTTHPAHLPAWRAAEIVGINTDLPQTSPVAPDGPLDTDSVKPTPTPTPLPTPTRSHAHADSKKCVIM